MVNITPCLPGVGAGLEGGSSLAYRCRPILKLMGDHETQTNVHSLEFHFLFCMQSEPFDEC